MFRKSNILFLLANIVVGVAVALICFYTAFLSALNDNATYKQLACVYSDSSYDFYAPSPVKEQVDEIKALPSVRSVYEYYNCPATVSVGGYTANADAMFSESDNLEITPFNDARLLSGNTSENAVFLTRSVAEVLEAEVGDAATIRILGKSITLPVGKIFLDDDQTKGKIIFKLTESVWSAIYNDQIRLMGVYIEATDAAAVKEYLKSYVPLGNLLPRDYFDSDLQYNSYVAEFKAQDYSSHINDKARLDESAKAINREYLSDADDMLIKAVFIIGSVMFVVVILNLIAIFACNRLFNQGSGHMVGLSRKSIALSLALFALVAIVCCAATFGIVYGVTVSDLLFVDSFNTKVIGYGLLAIFLGGAIGVAVCIGVCALRRK